MIQRTPSGVTNEIGDEVRVAIRGPRCAIAVMNANVTSFSAHMETISNLLSGIPWRVVIAVPGMEEGIETGWAISKISSGLNSLWNPGILSFRIAQGFDPKV